MLRKTLSEKEDQMFEMFEVRTQKSPQGFHLAGSQDFDDGSGNHQPRILVELAGVEPASEITTPSALHA